jgi:magnesium transporter
MTLLTTIIRDGSLQSIELPFDEISDVLQRGDTLVWVDVTRPSAVELLQLQEEFDLPPLAVEDAVEAHQRPKIHRYERSLFAVAYGASMSLGGIHLSEVGMFVAPLFVITVRHDPILDIEPVRRRLETAPRDLQQRAAFIAYAMLDHLVDGYFDVLEEVEDRLADLEESLMQDRPEAGDLSATFQLRRDIVSFRRVVAPLREVLNTLLRRDETGLGPELDEYFRDLYDHVIKVYEELDVGRELLSAALEAYMSVVSNRLNNVVLKVSAWAAIIAVPTFIASVYGMNFRHMPELRWGFGYPTAILAMLACAGVLYALFKRRGWL